MNRNSVTAPPVVVSPVPGEPPAQNQRGLLVGVIFRAAFKALQANRLRSFLTMLGVIIGVGAVIAAVTLTQGVSANIDQRFASLGTNIIYVIPGSASSKGVQTGLGSVSSLTVGDASAMAGVGNVTAVSPVDGTSGQAVYRNQTWGGGVYGVYPSIKTSRTGRLPKAPGLARVKKQQEHPMSYWGQRWCRLSLARRELILLARRFASTARSSTWWERFRHRERATTIPSSCPSVRSSSASVTHPSSIKSISRWTMSTTWPRCSRILPPCWSSGTISSQAWLMIFAHTRRTSLSRMRNRALHCW